MPLFHRRLREINLEELYALVKHADAQLALKAAADDVAQHARRRAPKDTGAGAASIHAEKTGDHYRVSWDQEHDYMRFSELGTRTRRARPFLRPAVTDVKGGR